MGSGPSRADYRERINRLVTQVIPSDEASFWNDLFDFPSSEDFVYTLVSPDDVRSIAVKHTANLSVILGKIVEIFEKAADAGSATVLTRGKVINCIRFLIRIFSVCHEEAIRPFAHKIFWGSPSTDDGDDEPIAAGESEENDGPLAHRLMDAMMDLLFLRNLTLHPGNFSAADPLKKIWFSGLKVEEVQEAPSGVEDCRSELLKCFLACFAGNMFHAPEDQVRYNNKWLEYATRLDTENAEPLFYSLLNAILSYDPIGWGVPYSTIVVGDDVESVLDSAAQLLIVLLDYRSPAETRANHEDQDQGTSPRTKVYYNIYRKMIAELDGQESFQKIYRKLVFLLSNPVVASNTYLPGSTHSIECFQELLVLFWKIAEINQKFLNHVLTYEDVNEFVVPCLYYLSENRKDSARVGLIHVGVFSLLMLSGERQFGVQLNKPYTANLSMNIPVFYGNHADLVILVLHKLIVDGNVRLNILFDCFLTIIVNISPYIKTLSMVASLKLMNMFEYLASPKFIYADKHNYRHVFYLVEAFNNIIQYQGDGNANLIYAIICRHKIFKELASVPLEAPVMKKRINRIEAALAASASSSASRASALALTSTQAVSPSDVAITTDAESAEKSGQSVPAPSVATEAEPVTTSEASSSSAAQPSSSASATEKFTPTLEWIESWKQKLPMQTILRLIEVIHPAIESFCSSSDDGGNELKVLELIRKTTLVGLLPVPHPILTRKYRSHEPINIWFSSFIWGVIYVRNQSPPIFFGSKIKLFVVNVVESG